MNYYNMKKTAIFISKDENLIEEFSDYLRINEFDTFVCADSDSGIKHFFNNKKTTSVVIMDIVEEEELKLISLIKNKREIPVVILAPREDELAAAQAFYAGADDYMARPLRLGELIARIKGHVNNYERIRKSLLGEPEIIEAEGLRIETGSHRVFVDDREVKLSLKEFELLTYLAENPGVVLTREDIYRNIWGMDSMGNMATLTVHIKKLREKLEKDKYSDRFIETMWGVGYRFKIKG